MDIWQYKSVTWGEDGAPAEHDIAGEDFGRLVELCFPLADVFSMNRAPWTFAKDRRLEHALEEFRIDSFETDHWFCYQKTDPPLAVNLYRASPEAKTALLRFGGSLFLDGGDPKYFCSLEDICFFRSGELFFGTVTHERLCFAHILTAEFGAGLLRLGGWEDGAENAAARLNIGRP